MVMADAPQIIRDARFRASPTFVPPRPQPQTFNTLGVIVLAVGVGVLGAYMLDWHGHQCEACSHKWRHLGAFNLGDPASHTCSKCGTVQWWKDGMPHVFRDVLRTTSTDATRARIALAAPPPTPALVASTPPAAMTLPAQSLEGRYR
jgi:hypothetical protein